MYKDHVPTIAAAMHHDVDTFARGVMFALLSARVQFPRVPDQCKELAAKGADATCLWGWKFDAYAYVTEYKDGLFALCVTAPTIEDKLFAITRIPGMGVAKGAFVLQLMGYDIACLDARNIQRESRHPRAYDSRGGTRKDAKAFRRMIDRYVADVGGKAQEYWDAWCIDVGAGYGMTADEISALHLTSIVPKSQRDLHMAAPVQLSGEIPF